MEDAGDAETAGVFTRIADVLGHPEVVLAITTTGEEVSMGIVTYVEKEGIGCLSVHTCNNFVT